MLQVVLKNPLKDRAIRILDGRFRSDYFMLYDAPLPHTLHAEVRALGDIARPPRHNMLIVGVVPQHSVQWMVCFHAPFVGRVQDDLSFTYSLVGAINHSLSEHIPLRAVGVGLPTVTPQHMDFGAITFGELRTARVIVHNEGAPVQAAVSIACPQKGPCPFALSGAHNATAEVELARGATVLSIAFRPGTSAQHVAKLTLQLPMDAFISVALSGASKHCLCCVQQPLTFVVLSGVGTPVPVQDASCREVRISCGDEKVTDKKGLSWESGSSYLGPGTAIAMQC